MPSVEELSVTAVRSAMAAGFNPRQVASELVQRSRHNVTALRMARARVERGAGWRSGPIGQRARDVLTMAIELCDESEPDTAPGAAADPIVASGSIDSGSIDLTDLEPIDLRSEAIELDVDLRLNDSQLDSSELDDTLPA